MDLTIKFMTLLLWGYALSVGVWVIWWKMIEASSGSFHQKQKEQFHDFILTVGLPQMLLNPRYFLPLLGCMVSQIKTKTKYHWKAFQLKREFLINYKHFKYYVMYSDLLEPLDPVFYRRYLENIVKNFFIDLDNLKTYEEMLGIKSNVREKISPEGWKLIEDIKNNQWHFKAQEGTYENTKS